MSRCAIYIEQMNESTYRPRKEENDVAMACVIRHQDQARSYGNTGIRERDARRMIGDVCSVVV